MFRYALPVALLATNLLPSISHAADQSPAAIQGAIERAGTNAAEIRRALDAAPASRRPGMEFLVANMPDSDLKSLSADFLLENLDLAYRARSEALWQDRLSDDLFLNYVLPYSNVNERRDNWRRDFRDRLLPLVREAKTPGEVAALLNNKLFPLLGVKYSTKRQKSDQSPYESTESGLASCTGLSILLIDACRAVGVPARFVGTPMWSDQSGNHSWVEVWDDGWHFTGAAEPNGNTLDAAWFTTRAATAKRDDPQHAIYAISFQRTPLRFPCEWNPQVDYISAVNVTDRYAAPQAALPEGMAHAMFRVLDGVGQRCACALRVESESGDIQFTGQTKDERFDANDHVTATLPIGKTYRVKVSGPNGTVETTIELRQSDQLFTLHLPALASSAVAAGDDRTTDPIQSLREYLAIGADMRPPLEDQPFAQASLSRAEFELARKLVWDDHLSRLRATRAAEMQELCLRDGELKMPFAYKTFGVKPQTGHCLYISLHGGGEAPKEVNDKQWENQKSLYEPAEGIYLAPRAPTDHWNMWHLEHVDRLFARLIEDMIAFEGVDPNRVYLLGYSAGGDGVYQLAPRMADRWAAAAMVAGHPNDASPLGLRNIGFAIYVGADDVAFQRNEVAGQWKDELAQLQHDDPTGYQHIVEIPPGKGHWMDHLDAATIPWMARFVRNPAPDRVVWKQDDVLHRQFYWLAMDDQQAKPGAEVVATRDGRQIDLRVNGVKQIMLRFDDRIVDLDQPVRVTAAGQTLFAGKLSRRIATLAKTLQERPDPEYLFASELTVSISE
jgi:hypothetical protein